MRVNILLFPPIRAVRPPIAMPRRQVLVLAAALLLTPALTSCNSYSAVSEYQQVQQQKKSFTETVSATGGKVEMKAYSVGGVNGSAWNLQLPGAKIPDDLITLMVGTGYLAECNLAKSSITDEQLLKMDELRLLQFTMNLDLSDTAISDAGFSKLKHLRALSKVVLKGSKVTQAGIDEFKKSYLANPETIAIFKKPKFEK